jgi:ribonuclease D
MADHPESSLIVDSAGLGDLLNHLRQARRFALDTEFVSEDSYRPELCLIQIATAERLALIDPLTLGHKTLHALWDAICDPSHEVVLHAAGEDLRIVWLESGRLPVRVVDVQVAAGLLGGVYPISLANLVERVVGTRVAGGETRTDWRRRPLSEAQLRYALDDVRYLLPIADDLQTKLTERNRLEWAEAEYSLALEAVRGRDDENRWRRIPGVHQLSRRGLEAARRLWLWREESARRTNRPVRQVLRDDLLIGIARRQPANRRELESLRDLNRPHLMAKANELLECVTGAMAVPEHELPHHQRRPEERPGAAMVVNLLTAGLGDACARHEVAPSLVGTASDLRDLVRWFVDGADRDHPPSLLRGWRGNVCGTTLLDLLQGRTRLRIANPESDSPVVLEPTNECRPGSTEALP